MWKSRIILKIILVIMESKSLLFFTAYDFINLLQGQLC